MNRTGRLASALLVAAAAAWAGVFLVARAMHGGAAMTGTMGLGVVAFVAVWTLMMTAMMLPSVVPFAQVFTRTIDAQRGRRTVAFASGYLVIWALAAAPAFGLAVAADRLVDGHPAGATALAVAVFGACGVYQFTSWKHRCLTHCRSPLGSVLRYGNVRGVAREFRVGLHHGAFCFGCCWSLMVVLIAFGLMNVAAMVALAAVVVAEKTWRHGPRVAQFAGVVACVLAVLVVVRPGLAPALDHPSMRMGGM